MARPLKVPAQSRKRYRRDLARLPVLPSLASRVDAGPLVNYYRATLEGGQVYVTEEEDVIRLYNMGFFGKGSLSRGQPDFDEYQYSAGRNEDKASRVISKRRYYKHRAWAITESVILPASIDPTFRRYKPWKKLKRKFPSSLSTLSADTSINPSTRHFTPNPNLTSKQYTKSEEIDEIVKFVVPPKEEKDPWDNVEADMDFWAAADDSSISPKKGGDSPGRDDEAKRLGSRLETSPNLFRQSFEESPAQVASIIFPTHCVDQKSSTGQSNASRTTDFRCISVVSPVSDTSKTISVTSPVSTTEWNNKCPVVNEPRPFRNSSSVGRMSACPQSTSSHIYETLSIEEKLVDHMSKLKEPIIEDRDELSLLFGDKDCINCCEEVISSCSDTDDNDGDVIVIDDSMTEDDGYDDDSDTVCWQSCWKKDYYPITERLQLSYEEAFFLTYALGCLVVTNAETKLNMKISELWREFRRLDPLFIPRYVAYHYYRSKGWVLKTGLKYGADFVLYKKGPAFFHSSFSILVRPITSDRSADPYFPQHPLNWRSLACVDRVVDTVAKEVVYCYVIRCGHAHDESLTEADLDSPKCIKNFKVAEVHLKRWVSKEERDKGDVTVS